MDGSYAITNVGKWGGVVILGIASNNLTLAKNNVTLGAGHLCVGYDGVGYIEGFDASNGLNLFGAGDPQTLDQVRAADAAAMRRGGFCADSFRG